MFFSRIIICVETKLDIRRVIELANSKLATVGNIFELITSDVDMYTEEREKFYLEKFKSEFEQGIAVSSANMADYYANKIHGDVEADIKQFFNAYLDEAINAVLDAKNENKFKSKKSSTNLLILLASIKESHGLPTN